jgi:hypothetical protein
VKYEYLAKAVEVLNCKRNTKSSNLLPPDVKLPIRRTQAYSTVESDRGHYSENSRYVRANVYKVSRRFFKDITFMHSKNGGDKQKNTDTMIEAVYGSNW